MELLIKRVADEDLDATISLFRREVYPGDAEGAQQHFTGHAEGQADTFLAWVDSRLAGYVTIRWISKDPEFSRQNIPLINDLAVFPQFRGQGIATCLMDAAEELIATRATRAGITVGLFDDYGPAQRLYAEGGTICRMGATRQEGQRPLHQGEHVTMDHDLILWLTKDLAP